MRQIRNFIIKFYRNLNITFIYNEELSKLLNLELLYLRKQNSYFHKLNTIIKFIS